MFTFKNIKTKGKFSSFDPEYHDIKLKKRKCGSISEISHFSNDYKFSERFQIQLFVKDENNKNGWKQILFKKHFGDIGEAKKWLNNNFDDIVKKYELHFID